MILFYFNQIHDHEFLRQKKKMTIDNTKKKYNNR
jgi:hypothetical protein